MRDFDFSSGYQTAAIIVFPVVLFGFVCNLTVVVFLRSVSSLNNSFGSLTLSQAAADCAHQTIFLFYVVPCLFLRNEELYSWSEQVGFVLIIIYEICAMSHVCISLNRFTAVNAPFLYSRLFSVRNTRALTFLQWTIAITFTTYTLKLLDCSCYLPLGSWLFIFKDTPICRTVTWYADFLKYVAFVVIVAILDCCSIIKIHYINIRHCRNVGPQDVMSAARRNGERNLLYQACLQGIFFTSELIFFFILSPNARNKWELFLMSTVAWCTVHAMDGCIVLSCNREFRLKIKMTFFMRMDVVLLRSLTPRLSDTSTNYIGQESRL